MDTLLAVVAGVVIALATAFFTVKAYVHQATADLRNDYKRRFNERRWGSYTGLSTTFLELLKASKAGSTQRELPRLTDRLHDFMGELWLVGSDEVIMEFLRWRARTAEAQDGDEKIAMAALMQMAQILVAMRRDLGETDTKITADHILATFSNEALARIRP